MNKNKYTLSVLSSSPNYSGSESFVKNVASLREKPSFYCSDNYSQVDVFMGSTLVYTDSISNFVDKVSSHFKSISNVLVNTIRSLKLNQDYNGTYIAYLSGKLSDEEFLKEAQHYSYSPESELSMETLNDIRILFNLTKIEFSPSDIAHIFKIDYDKSVEAIEKLGLCAGEYLNE